MDQPHASRLRFLDANDIDDSVVDFDGLDVEGRDDRKLGDIDGFIVDPGNARVYYAVVDSGGWFSSRRFLVPIGHATLDRDRGVMRLDMTKESLREYPEFDEDRFRAFSDDDLRTFEQRMATICCPDDAAGELRPGYSHYDTRRHYQQPEWWRGGTWSPDRVGPIETRRSSSPVGTSASAPTLAPDRPAGSRAADEERELVRARGAEDSPHYGGRAQPGDVLGVETGGETTGIGDTPEDENKRREAAERAVRRDS
ncbi:MAG TPA: PRC-barrel domain-containing protein [Vicinamibacterales bacterium]|nr:PRC-barrel domain-containing protein [Vicinamibacterales bacterium]